jgi:hypothetical protein
MRGLLCCESLTAADGPKCRFAALRRYVRNRRKTGLVTDCLETSKMTRSRLWWCVSQWLVA